MEAGSWSQRPRPPRWRRRVAWAVTVRTSMLMGSLAHPSLPVSLRPCLMTDCLSPPVTLRWIIETFWLAIGQNAACVCNCVTEISSSLNIFSSYWHSVSIHNEMFCFKDHVAAHKIIQGLIWDFHFLNHEFSVLVLEYHLPWIFLPFFLLLQTHPVHLISYLLALAELICEWSSRENTKTCRTGGILGTTGLGICLLDHLGFT